MQERKLHIVSACGVALLVSSAGGGIAWTRGAHGGPGADDALKDVIAIEASIAMKSAAQAQPQKKVRAPEQPKVTPLANDLTTPSRPDDPTPPPTHDDKQNLEDAYKNLRRHDTEGEPVGTPSEDRSRGQFDGSEFGNADVTKGDPYWGELKNDMAWEFPKILSAAGTPEGCLHVTAEGKILETKLRTRSGDAPLDDSVERALDTVTKKRNDKPVPVPTRLLDQTEMWVCFKFTL